MAGDVVDYQNNTGSAVGFETMNCWYDQWNHHPWSIYPTISSYPVYIDKGRQAFEIVKQLNEKKLLAIKDVSDFIKVMGIVLGAL
jgi:hypothetical protein